MKLLQSGEDYLKAIMLLQQKNGTVRSVDVAKHLKVTKPSVSVAIRQLREGGFLTMGEDKLLRLTPSGREVAEHIQERHRIIKNGLVSLGVDSEIAERDACRIEHVISPESFEKIKAYWGRQAPQTHRDERKKR